MDRDRRTVDSYLPIRPVEFHIMLSLAAGERHGYGIIQDAETRGVGAVPDVGTLYRALARMTEQKLITSADGRRSPDTGDDRRQYYKLTAPGLQVARAEARRIAELMRAATLGGLLPERAR